MINFKKQDELLSPSEKAHELTCAIDNVAALGEAVIIMSLYSIRSFETVGLNIGNMIKDYSETISDLLGSSNKPYREFFEDQEKGASAKVDRQTEAPTTDQS